MLLCQVPSPYSVLLELQERCLTNGDGSLDSVFRDALIGHLIFSGPLLSPYFLKRRTEVTWQKR